MQNSLLKTISLLCAVILLTSCLKQSESIDPIARVQTLAQLQREAMMSTALTAGNGILTDAAQTSLDESNKDPEVFFLNLKYNIKELDVYETADIPNSFEKLSHSFLKTFIKLFLRIKGPQRVDIDPVELALPDFNLDFDVVKSIKVKRVYLEYNKEFDESVNNKASFAFVSGLDINRVGKDKSMLFSYKKTNNNCKYKCLDFTIANGDVFALLKNNSTSIILKPTLTIGALPKVTELILDGQIELQIGLKLPF
jgi:hypothetical protein